MKQEQTGEEILREMAQIRCELSDDMEGIVSGAQAMADWRYYVRTYPWACVGIAAAIGYLAVPQRLQVMRPTAKQLVELAHQEQLVIEPESVQRQRVRKQGLGDQLFSFLAGLAVRGATTYIGHQLGQLFGEQAAKSSQEQPQPGPYRGGAPGNFG